MDIDHVSKICRISLTEDEKKEFMSQIEKILDLFSEISDLEGNYEPLYHKKMDLRDDSAVLEEYPILENAPKRVANYFKVPKNL